MSIFSPRKKRLWRAILCTLALSIILGSFPIFHAAGVYITPAARVLAAQLSLIKTGLTEQDIRFTAEDFDAAIGTRVSSITILSLPQESAGCLMQDDHPVVRDQTIRRDALSSLRFVPSGSGTADASFTFGTVGNQAYRMSCSLYLLPTLNFAPTVSQHGGDFRHVSTYCNVALSGSLRAVDPENDALTYEIVSYPSRGLLTLTDPLCGNYLYRPAANYTGKDSFSFRARDCYGNETEDIRVSITVEKNRSGIEYSDMTNHWAYSAAIRVASAGILYGSTENASGTLFEPDRPVSRSAFLRMAMLASGQTVSTGVTATSFDDDDEIPAQDKPYVAAASRAGLVRGSMQNGKKVFRPGDSITRAEAAVMLAALLNLPTATYEPSFRDEQSIPTWAEDALYAVCEAGLLCGRQEGKISPSEPLTRAEAAQTLCVLLSLRNAA